MTRKNNYNKRLSDMVIKESIWELQDMVIKLRDAHLENEKELQELRKQISNLTSKFTKLKQIQHGK